MEDFIQIAFYIVSLAILLTKTLGSKKKRKQLKKQFNNLIEFLYAQLIRRGITDVVILKLNICFAMVMIVIYGIVGGVLTYFKYQSILIGLITLALMTLLGLNFMMKSIDLFNSLSKNK